MNIYLITKTLIKTHESFIRIDNTMVNRKRINNDYKTLHRRLNIEQRGPHEKQDELKCSQRVRSFGVSKLQTFLHLNGLTAHAL